MDTFAISRVVTRNLAKNSQSHDPKMSAPMKEEASEMEKKFVVIHSTEKEDPVVGMPPELIRNLEDRFSVVLHQNVLENPSVGAKVLGAFVRPTRDGRGHRFIQENFDLYPNLKVVANYGVGCDHIDIKLLNSRGIKVTNTPGVLGDAVAEMALLLMLASARNFVAAIDTAMGPNPVEEFPMNAVGVQVSSGTVGIIGMGDIGFKVAKRAHAFDMKVLYYNRNRRTAADEAAVGATYCQPDELLQQSDFVVITCPLTPETNGMIGKDQFNLMKPTATIVNVSRGKVIDQDAMVDALKANRIRGAALDVSTPEPLPRDHPLLKLSNVILTPHHGSATNKTRRNMERLMIENVLAGVEGKPLPNEVKPK